MDLAIAPITERYINNLRNAYTNWKKQAKVQIIPTALADLSEILDLYFTGTTPFKSKRSKNDFPDAVIHNSIIKLTQSMNRSCIVITNDDELRNALSKIVSVSAFKKLEDLYSSIILSPIILEKEKKDNENATIQLIQSQLKFHLTYIEREISGYIIEEAEYFYQPDGSMPSIGHPAFEGVTNNSSIELQINDQDAEYIGEGVFLIPIDGYIELVYTNLFRREVFNSLEKHEQKDYSVIDEDEDYVFAYSYSFDKIRAIVSVEFEEDEIVDGRILRRGLGLHIYNSKIEVEGDIKFSA